MAEATVIALLLHDTAVRCHSLAADSVLAVRRRKREDCRPLITFTQEYQYHQSVKAGGIFIHISVATSQQTEGREAYEQAIETLSASGLPCADQAVLLRSAHGGASEESGAAGTQAVSCPPWVRKEVESRKQRVSRGASVVRRVSEERCA